MSKTDSYSVDVGAPPPTPDFGISVSPTSGSAVQGGSKTATVNVSSIGGFSSPVTITVGYPSGSGLTFAITSNPMSAPSSATLTIQTASSTPAGAYTITITGTSGSLTHSCTYALTVTAAPTPADFGISVSPTSGSAVQGGSKTATVNVSSIGGFSSPVTITIGYPSGKGLTFAITSNPMSAPSSATLTIQTASSTPTGTYTITITGTGGGKTHSCTYTLTVTAGAAPDFTMSISPTSGSVARGGSTSTRITTSPVGGFSGSVTITIGYPSGKGLTFAISNYITLPSTPASTLYIYTASSTPTGTYTITITGTGGGKTHSCTYTLKVT